MSNGNPLTQRNVIYGVVFLLLLSAVGVAVWFSRSTGKLEEMEARGEARVEEVRGELDRFANRLDEVIKQLENQPRIVSVNEEGGGSSAGDAKLVSLTDMQTLAAARLSRFRAAVQEANTTIADASSVAQEWAVLEPQVRSGEAGRKVAADDQLVRRLQAAFEVAVATPSDVSAMSEELAAIEQSVEQRMATTQTDAPGEAVIDEVRRIEQKARVEQQGLKKRLVVVRSAIAASNQREPDESTLDEVFAELEAAETADQLLERQRVSEEAKAGAERRVADAIRELESAKQLRRLAELGEATGKELAEAERIAREAAQRRKDELARIEYEKRRREAMQPDKRRQLEPFFAKDFTQPDRYGGRGTETSEKEPMSLSKIRTMGALEPTTTGYRALLWLASGNWTARPRWNMQVKMTHIGQLTSSDREMLRGVQRTLEEYGDVYVKEGLLAP